VRVVPTPGHTDGHQSLVVDTRQGRVILAGQAVNTATDYARAVLARELSVAGAAVEPSSYPAWLDAFAALDPWRVHFAHDLAHWERPPSPEPGVPSPATA
jgi:glyoxylase-like metal-dependent hydrolase (beta-lactamase superfamily II)